MVSRTLAVALLLTAATAAEPKPNVVFILADDKDYSTGATGLRVA